MCRKAVEAFGRLCYLAKVIEGTALNDGIEVMSVQQIAA